MSDEDNIVTLVPKVVEEEKETAIDVDELFKRAKEAGFVDVVLMGVTEDDKVGFITNIESVAEVNLIIDQSKKHLLK